MSGKPSKKNIAIAKHAVSVFGGVPKILAYSHDHSELTVDLLSCTDAKADTVSYSTIRLPDHTLRLNNKKSALGVELAAVSMQADLAFPSIVVGCAFQIMKSGSLPTPGDCIENVLSEFIPDAELKHVYLTAPFPWEDALNSLQVGGKSIAWLMLVPITDGELVYKKRNGSDALDELFESRGVAYQDTARSCLIGR